VRRNDQAAICGAADRCKIDCNVALIVTQKGSFKMNKSTWYSQFAKSTAHFCGRPRVFTMAVGVILVWLITGPLFHFSDTWQLVINTGTTIITFLMVFLIQNTQNRDTQAIQVKLDELIRATKGAHNALLDLEELEEDTLNEFRTKYETLAKLAREELIQGIQDTGTPEA
jgi:low affinity Fe/Cu permease